MGGWGARDPSPGLPLGRRARGLAITALLLLAATPAAAPAQHTKLALESIGPAGGNGAFPADVASPLGAGRRVLLTTAEPLASPDSDSTVDVYSRDGGTLALQSAGVTGGNGEYPVSIGSGRAGGTRVVFQTDERLVAADTDSSLDVYVRDAGTTTLVSTGTGPGVNGAFDSTFADASADGTRIFFATRGSLAAGDTDSSIDVYERSGGTTNLVSTGPAGANGMPGAELVGISDDGAKAFFTTSESLLAADTDSAQDVYQRSNGTTTLLSVGPTGGNAQLSASYADSSSDGSRVFFHTAEALLASDTDDGVDVYERTGGTTTSIHSLGPNGGNSGAAAGLAGISADGTTVFVETPEKLIPNPVDRDAQPDVYRSAGGNLTLVSPGGNDTVATPAYLAAVSADGSRAFIRSEEALASGDTDKYQDIYEFSGGTLTRISLGAAGGNGPMHAFFGGISEDGARVFFETYESLDAGDTDARTDVYERHAGATARVSTGNGDFDATLRAVSADGARVFFRTAESLLGADTDAVADVYSASVPGTLTVVLDSIPDDPQDVAFTAGGGLSPAAFQLDDDADGVLPRTRTFANLAPGAGYSVTQSLPGGWIPVSATCDDGSPVSAIDVEAGEAVTCTFVNQRGYPRPRTATPVSVPLVPAFAQCTSPNRTHGPTLVYPSCNPPAAASSPLTVGTPDANGAAANMTGRVRFRAVAGDATISIEASDVRLRTGLADYAGELQGVVTLRVTDRLNGAGQNEVGTVTDLPLNVTVPCTASVALTIGSTCAASTSADAVVPGMVSESKRTIWQMGDVRVFDGGPDGQVSTAGNTLFLRQGIFVP